MFRDPRLGKLPKCPRQRPPAAGHTKGTDMTDTLKAGDELSLGGVLTSTSRGFAMTLRRSVSIIVAGLAVFVGSATVSAQPASASTGNTECRETGVMEYEGIDYPVLDCVYKGGG